MATALVLDSWAVLAFLQGEPAAEAVERVLGDACDGDTQLLMCAVNLGEVYYTALRRGGEEMAEAMLRDLMTLGIQVSDANWELTRLAARFKARGGLACADCFAAALAVTRGARLVTGDREIERLASEVDILWV